MELEHTVIVNGYCIGCGACAALSNSAYEIIMDKKGRYVAQKTGNRTTSNATLICPFSSTSANESEIANNLFPGKYFRNKYLGSYIELYAGHVHEGNYRNTGSSGGVAKWILHELLKNDCIDAVIQVVENDSPERGKKIYKYQVANQLDNVIKGSKSAYYPVEMSEILAYVKSNPGRYAITGVPCFIKAIRLLQQQEDVFRDRIIYCIGLFCGHMKTTRYAEMLGWQLGVDPADLTYIDFRRTLPGKNASDKGIVVRSFSDPRSDADPVVTRELWGGGYNLGFFQYEACNYCDDVVAELADVSIGDAWLPEYIKDGKGTSIIIVRNDEIRDIVKLAISEDRLSFQSIGSDKVIQSQIGGFKQRREGLSYRLSVRDKEGIWRPKKRVSPKNLFLRPKRRKIYRLRMEISRKSHDAFNMAMDLGDFAELKKIMSPLVSEYQSLYAPSLVNRIKRGVARRIKKITKKQLNISKNAN